MTCHAITMSVPLVDLWSYLALLVLISVSFLWLPLCTMFILEKTITPVSIPGLPTIYQQVMGLFTPLRASRTRTSTTNILSFLYPFENEFITGLCPVDYMGARYLLPSWASMVSWTDLIGCSSMVWLVNWTVGAAYTSCVRCASALHSEKENVPRDTKMKNVPRDIWTGLLTGHFALKCPVVAGHF